MKSEKQHVVLELLRQFARPVSRLELLQNLGSGYAERILRRWLVELVRSRRLEAL